jgi:hypothetical protein
MSAFKMIMGNKEYLVTERNRRSGLYELFSYENGSTHIIGRSCKNSNWIYISKSPFCPSLCLEEVCPQLEKCLSCTQEHALAS